MKKIFQKFHLMLNLIISTINAGINKTTKKSIIVLLSESEDG